MSYYYDKISSFIRINFIGRPYELNKLVFDNDSILSNKEEANRITKAYRKFKGFQYIGNVITFVSIYAANKLSIKYQLNRKTQLIPIAVSFFPLLIAHSYSYFIYWDSIRDVVLNTRERNKKYSHLIGGEIEDFKIVFNTSKDLHRYIQSNIGIKNCFFEIFHV